MAAGRISETGEDERTAEGAFKIVDRRGQQRFLFDTRKPPIIIGGKTYAPETRQGPDASYLIFNDENGNEKGGIIAAGDGALVALDYPTGDGIHLRTRWQDKAGGAALVMRHMGDPTTPIEEAVHHLGLRLFVDTENGTGLTLCDREGRPRIQLRVAMDGTPSIAILDEQGAVLKQL
ncbi:hypothetical protein [Nocardia asiatica]|uniref:hypothetical protein n=1 Tax=Nocardia asiatica TaxID=209252 RepID=UPI003EE23FA1